jgi:hypothetical protein
MCRALRCRVEHALLASRRRRATSRSRGSAEPRFTSTLVEPNGDRRVRSRRRVRVPARERIQRPATEDASTARGKAGSAPDRRAAMSVRPFELRLSRQRA